MKPFGRYSPSFSHGYDLPLVISHLEALLDYEVNEAHSRGISRKAMTRIELVEKALANLEEAAAMANEE